MKINIENFLVRKNLITAILLLFILAVSLFLRLYKLDLYPLGFHTDEASLGYNAYSILKTGKDENNNKLPLYIDTFGDNRPTGYVYLDIIFVKFMGLSEVSTRLPGALFGAFLVLPFFLLVEILFKSRKLSIISSFLIAISPWSIILSRASDEAIVALFFIVSGFLLLLIGFQKQKSKFYFAGAIVLALSFFFYHTPRIFVPLLFFIFIFYLYSKWKNFNIKNKASIILAFIIVSFVSIFLVFLLKGGTGRFSQVNIFSFPETKLLMEEQFREDGVSKAPLFITRVFHNKIINYSLGYLGNYFDYFSGKYLFLSGGLPIRYRVPAMGLIYIVELPFILLGTFYLLKSKNKYYKLPLIWLIIAPVTAALTRDDIPNINRTVIMFPMIELVASFGLLASINQLKYTKRTILVGLVSIFIFFNFFYFLHQYFVHAPVDKNWYRYEGFKQMILAVKNDYLNYDKIFVTSSVNGGYSLILFYLKYDPNMYQKEGSTKDKSYTGFGRFFFVHYSCPPFLPDDPKIPKVKKFIIIDNGNCPTKKNLLYDNLNYDNYKYIYKKDGTKAYRILYEKL